MSDHSIWVKVGLYTFDVGSDWVNGGLMLDCSSNSTLNKTIFNTTLSKDDGCEPWWGSITIAMSWSPPTILFFIGILFIGFTIKEGSPSPGVFCGQICLFTCLGPIIYVLWPLLVPLGMIYGAYFDDEGLQESMTGQISFMSKSMEGIVESGPQLVLQLYIIARNGIGRKIENRIDMSMGDWVQLLSMLMSTFTINLASVEAFDFLEFAMNDGAPAPKRSLKDTFMSWVKIAPFNLPGIVFRTGTIATFLYTFRPYGLMYFFIWLLVLLIISFKIEDFWDYRVVFVGPSMCLNIFTTILPGNRISEDTFGKPKTVVSRLVTWSTFVINSLALGLSYFLPTKNITTLHLHDNKSDWMENNLLSVTVSLFALGLFSSIMIEIYQKWFPEWLETIPSNKKPTTDDEEENDEALEMTPKP